MLFFFEFFQNDLLDGMWYWDLENPEYEWMNERFWQVLGYDAHEKLHLVSEWQDIIFKEDLALATRNFHLHLQDPNNPYDQHVRYRHKNGSIVWVRCRGVAIHNIEGKPVRFVGVHSDVTPLMERYEDALLKKLKLKHAAVDSHKFQIKINSLKAQNDALLKEKSNLENVWPDTGVTKNSHFYVTAMDFSSYAKRLGLQLNIVEVAIVDSKDIINSFGQPVLTDVKISLHQLLENSFADMIITELADDSLTGITFGFADEQFKSLNDNLKEKTNSHPWSITKPKLKFKYQSIAPVENVESLKHLLSVW